MKWELRESVFRSPGRHEFKINQTVVTVNVADDGTFELDSPGDFPMWAFAKPAHERKQPRLFAREPSFLIRMIRKLRSLFPRHRPI
jgi:hypothetical protein